MGTYTMSGINNHRWWSASGHKMRLSHFRLLCDQDLPFLQAKRRRGWRWATYNTAADLSQLNNIGSSSLLRRNVVVKVSHRWRNVGDTMSLLFAQRASSSRLRTYRQLIQNKSEAQEEMDTWRIESNWKQFDSVPRSATVGKSSNMGCCWSQRLDKWSCVGRSNSSLQCYIEITGHSYDGVMPGRGSYALLPGLSIVLRPSP